MKLITSSVELLKQEPGIAGINKMIELAGRTCYKSEDKITDNSAEAFVQRMINSHHTAMLEHGAVYLYLEVNSENAFKKFEYPLAHFSASYNWSDVVGNTAARYENNKYSKVVSIYDKSTHKVYITTNYRVIIENGWMDDLQFICEPTEFHQKRIALRFQADIHFYKDDTRQRKKSFAIESTRWCNYMRDRFGMSINFMKPTWIKHEDLNELGEDCKKIEEIYFKWIKKGYKAEHAAYFLPQGTAATVVVTAFAEDWRHFFDLRLFEKTGKVHPDMLDLATKAKQVLADNNLWDYIMKHPSKFD